MTQTRRRSSCCNRLRAPAKRVRNLGRNQFASKCCCPNMEDIVFGDELSIDLMFIDGQAVLHVFDTATRFSAATSLDSHNDSFGQSVEGVWLALIETWFTLYTGYPNRLRIDAGSIFASPRWKELSNMAGITLRMSGVEAHNSLGIGERMHGPLRRIYTTRFEWITHTFRLELS
jgi:transposase InsO family protein